MSFDDLFKDTLVGNTEIILKSIGETVIAFQSIELDLAEVLSELLKMKIDQDIYRIASSMSFSQKANLMSDLYKERKNPKWPELEFPLTRQALEAAENFRNTIVHSFWGVERGEHWVKIKANIRGRNGLNVSRGKVDVKTFREGVEQVREIRNYWYLGKSEKLRTAKDRLNEISATMAK